MKSRQEHSLEPRAVGETSGFIAAASRVFRNSHHPFLSPCPHTTQESLQHSTRKKLSFRHVENNRRHSDQCRVAAHSSPTPAAPAQDPPMVGVYGPNQLSKERQLLPAVAPGRRQCHTRGSVPPRPDSSQDYRRSSGRTKQCHDSSVCARLPRALGTHGTMGS